MIRWAPADHDLMDQFLDDTLEKLLDDGDITEAHDKLAAVILALGKGDPSFRDKMKEALDGGADP